MALNFSLFGILGLILYAGCIFHAIKTGRINYWLLILIFLPGLGSIAYLLIEVLPELRNNRTARRALAGIGGAFDPNRDLRESEASLEVADTADNKRHLAEGRMKRGQHISKSRKRRLTNLAYYGARRFSRAYACP